jgi:flagella basal body P-ring formation protein FlgA
MNTAFGKKMAVVLLMLWAVATCFPVASFAGSITVEEMKTAIIRYVEKTMHWPADTMRLDCRSKFTEVVFPGENLRIEVTARPDQDFIGETAFGLKYYAGENLVKEETLRVALEVLKDVVVSTKALSKGKPISVEDVCVIKKWVKRLPGQMATVPEEVIGKVLTVNVRQNNEIAKNILKEPIVIKKGNAVQILLDNGDFSISTMGISEENGIAESLIRVKNASSNKIIFARVVSESVVKVQF